MAVAVHPMLFQRERLRAYLVPWQALFSILATQEALLVCDFYQTFIHLTCSLNYILYIRTLKVYGSGLLLLEVHRRIPLDLYILTYY